MWLKLLVVDVEFEQESEYGAISGIRQVGNRSCLGGFRAIYNVSLARKISYSSQHPEYIRN